MKTFLTLVGSVKFPNADADAEWSLPEGSSREPGDTVRFRR